ncbi:MAG: sulfite exporter TauE/SafE family protein [candidate division Zixibacteria bacterium]|nr:sulfite exporter TauE/SafE family protein [candidate division Zixibacteria bacterium]
MHFPISGVDTYWWLPMVVAFAISCVTSTGGLSGAFLLLPFQVSVLGFVSPAVTPTNLLFNIVAIPSGVYRYYREKRMVWSITAITILGTLPGLFGGIYIRTKYMPNPRPFKLFVGLVLLYIGIRLISDVLKKARKPSVKPAGPEKFEVTPLAFNLKWIGFEFNGKPYYVKTLPVFMLSLVVGIIGGIYGIGGGAIISPFLVTVFGLPVYSVAGAALFGTFLTSVAGVLAYAVIAPLFASTGTVTQPDWMLGILFGIGGAAGMYTGARLQRHLPARVIKTILFLIMFFIAGRYIWEFFR